MADTLSNVFGILFAVGVLLFGVSAVSEYILGMLWIPFYYRNGFQVYRQRIIIPKVDDISNGLKYLSKNLRVGFLKLNALEFYQLDPNYYAFRTVLAFAWGPWRWRGGLMRQSLDYDPKTGELTIVGYLNFSPAIWAVLLIFAWAGGLLQIEGNFVQAFFMAFIFSIVTLGAVFLLVVLSYNGEVKLNRLIETNLLQYFQKEQRAQEKKQPRP